MDALLAVLNEDNLPYPPNLIKLMLYSAQLKNDITLTYPATYDQGFPWMILGVHVLDFERRDNKFQRTTPLKISRKTAKE